MPLTPIAIVAGAGLYATGLTRLWRRAGVGQGITRAQVAAAAAGWATLWIALVSPLPWLSAILFSAHMTQHELLMIVAAPLFAFAKPALAALWVLSSRARVRAGMLLHAPIVHGAWRRLTSPFAAFALHGVALWIWHAPVLFDAALHSPVVHGVQHLSFFLTAMLFWWAMVHGRYGRLGYGVAVCYVFLTTLHNSALGLLFVVSEGVWYRPYAATGAARRIDPLADQQLAGLLMWIPAGVVLMVFGLALFAAWLGAAARREQTAP
jgi:cytochrome c oxidase assembly factor CtaG